MKKLLAPLSELQKKLLQETQEKMVKEAMSALKSKPMWKGQISSASKQLYIENSELAMNAFLLAESKEGGSK